ncbi:restriction endonuclease subunit S [candidate division WOR-3 bacterium]|nr:restriction endonuclease subunit S [candidate division WOR-3 bacterium]
MGREKWVEVPLGSVANYINGRAFKPSEWSKSGLPIIRIQNLTKSTNIINYSKIKHEKKYFIENGDLLMAWSATLDVFIWDGGSAWLNQHIFNVIVNSEIIDKKFLYFSLKQAISEFNTKTHGSGMVHITKPVFETHKIPLPPLNEQKRIVEKLDAILPRVQTAKFRLRKIPVLLKKFRQSVLSSACSGKLTEDWREGKDTFSYYLLNKSHSPLREYSEYLPDNWKIFSFIDVCKISTNLVDPKNFQNFPHIAPDNIEKGTGKLLGYRTIKQDNVKSAKHRFYEGQIIYSKIRPYLSKAIISYFDGLCSADMYPLTCNINTKFLYFYILSNIFLDLASTAGDRSVLPKINQKELSLIPVPVPPKEEQHEIVRRVEKLFTLADSLEVKYKKALEKIEKLEQSILSKAFRGELISSDPNDESADKLLEKILEEKK